MGQLRQVSSYFYLFINKKLNSIFFSMTYYHVIWIFKPIMELHDVHNKKLYGQKHYYCTFNQKYQVTLKSLKKLPKLPLVSLDICQWKKHEKCWAPFISTVNSFICIIEKLLVWNNKERLLIYLYSYAC